MHLTNFNYKDIILLGFISKKIEPKVTSTTICDDRTPIV